MLEDVRQSEILNATVVALSPQKKFPKLSGPVTAADAERLRLEFLNAVEGDEHPLMSFGDLAASRRGYDEHAGVSPYPCEYLEDQSRYLRTRWQRSLRRASLEAEYNSPPTRVSYRGSSTQEAR